MNYKRIFTAAGVAVIFSALAACSDNSNADSSGSTANDTNLTDTRRNSDDTINYMANDSANKMKVQTDTQ